MTPAGAAGDLSAPAASAAVKNYLTSLHDRITAALESVDSARFRRDAWQRPEGGGGESRILAEGSVFERAGVSFSHVFGAAMPQSARTAVRGATFHFELPAATDGTATTDH